MIDWRVIRTSDIAWLSLFHIFVTQFFSLATTSSVQY
jgi:hypothetical protein